MFRKAGPILWLTWSIALTISATRVDVSGAGNQISAQTAPVPAATNRTLVDRYCVGCHSVRRKSGGLVLEGLDVANPSANGASWEQVIRKLRSGAMPPAGLPRPAKAEQQQFLASLEAKLDADAAAHPNPGRTAVFHRLNRSEYRNAIRDLLALDVDVAGLLPADTESYGFDNIGDVLGVNPTLLESYLTAARKISRMAVGSSSVPVTSEVYRLSPELTQDEHVDGLPLGTRGGILVHHFFPLDGDYEIRVRLSRDYNQTINGLAETLDGVTAPHQLEITLDGERLRMFAPGENLVKPGERQKYDGFFNIDPRLLKADEGMSVRAAVKAGPRSLGVTFIKRTSALLEDVREPFARADVEQGDTHEQPYVGSVTITGPFNAHPGSDTPSRQRIFTCHPAREADAARCAREIFRTLAHRAYRRPASDAELQVLMDAFGSGRTAGFDAGIEKGLLRILVSPSFLFRIEHDPAMAPSGTPYRIAPIDLASRLSFFLWSSIPDEPLLSAAERGTLSDPAGLERQVRRMLADPRSSALVENFAGQWLYLRNVEGARPDRMLFADFDENLREAFRRETDLFVGSIFRDDRSILQFLDADYTFVNERLARHYGIPGVYGDAFQRVKAPEGRGGLLGQGSVLTIQSHANRTSPVLRGVWILENILGTPPPPPPPNVPDLKDTDADGKVLSMRQRMAQHRSNPACATCHAQMDPLGLSLENFDAIGQMRARDESNEPIDATGTLPDGTTFKGLTGLKQALLARSDQFVTTFTEKLMTYALGRGLESYDAPAIRRITHNAAAANYRFSDIVLGIVRSVPFQMKMAGERPGPTDQGAVQ